MEPEIKLPKSGSNNEQSLIKVGNASFYTADYKIEWLLEIPANETKTINLKYQVELPLGAEMTGL